MAELPSFKLIIVDDEGKSTVVPLTRIEYSIGRQEGNVIRLTERNVSRKHGRLYKENGKFVIEDLKSYNGVFVNNERIKDKVLLKSGDSMQIGDYRLVFREITGVETEDSVIVREMVRPPLPRVASALPGERPKLIIINGPKPGQIINLEEGETILGRSENATVIIDEASVSREHGKIVLKESYCQILDLGSSNGVKINGVQIKEHYLSHGDTIELGNILIRFIAAGAWDLLLEQLQQQEALAAAPGWRKPAYIAIPFILVGVAVLGGVVYLLSAGQRPSNNDKTGIELGASEQKGLDKITNVDELIRGAQKNYDQLKWRDAINYAAKALQYEPSNEKALKIKERATRELENQPIFEEGLNALKAQQWETAYRTFARLSLDSAYRTKPEFQKAITKFLDQLQEEMARAYSNHDLGAVEEKALIIDSIPEASEWHKSEARKYAQLIKKEMKKDTGGGAGAESGPKEKKKKKDGTEVVEEETSAGTGDPVEEARKAILAGDQLKCIKILEKAKTSQMTLKLLATCYKAAGNMDRYFHILERYISKYPTAPDAEKFRTILKQAGKL
jgi:pSer/pThr/pTyr-binding forkhead associated (FHA) protein